MTKQDPFWFDPIFDAVKLQEENRERLMEIQRAVTRIGLNDLSRELLEIITDLGKTGRTITRAVQSYYADQHTERETT